MTFSFAGGCLAKENRASSYVHNAHPAFLIASASRFTALSASANPLVYRDQREADLRRRRRFALSFAIRRRRRPRRRLRHFKPSSRRQIGPTPCEPGPAVDCAPVQTPYDAPPFGGRLARRARNLMRICSPRATRSRGSPRKARRRADGRWGKVRRPFRFRHLRLAVVRGDKIVTEVA
jgi:hypothetical protein